MKIKTLATIVLLAGLSTAVAAQSKEAVFSPEKGIICDKKSHFCADSQGISLSFTEMYLGKKAVAAFNKITEGIQDMDMKRYTLSNGLSCDSEKHICKKSKWDEKADRHWTEILFGK